MKIVTTPSEMQACAREIHARGETIACVPTMGCLHEGHLSLVDRAHREADRVVLTLVLFLCSVSLVTLTAIARASVTALTQAVLSILLVKVHSSLSSGITLFPSLSAA